MLGGKSAEDIRSFDQPISARLQYKDIAESGLGFRKKKDKQWITPETWWKINERRKAKDNLLNAKSPRLTQRAKEEYKIKD